jgi:viroplasmin and RNaseH domain-containing protein
MLTLRLLQPTLGKKELRQRTRSIWLRRQKKEKPRKYYAVAAGRTRGIFTDWDEVEASVDRYPYSSHKSFKSYREAKVWYKHKRRFLRRRRQRRGSPDASGSDSDGSYRRARS